jgi:hypothetical protein
VFAIRLSLEQNVVYQGIFKLPTDGADRIVEELKSFTDQSTYSIAADFITRIQLPSA